jgi:hypothetical protein
MRPTGYARRVMRGGVLLAALSGAPGCLSYLHPVDPPPPELAGLCRSVPKCSRDHVYVFLVHGMDPLNFANLSGLRDYVQSLGFNKTYYGQLYHTIQFDKQIHQIHNQDPEAHFVLIGFSFGANMVRSLAQWAKDEGISIDLLVYLGGNTLENTPEDKPANVKQIVNILASGCIWNGAYMDGAINMHETNVWHFGSPTHKETLQVLSEQLARVAEAVPFKPDDAPLLPAPHEEPTPRPAMSHVAAKPVEGDCLRPLSRMRMPGVARRPEDYEQRRLAQEQMPRVGQTAVADKLPELDSKKDLLPSLEASGLDLPRPR